MDSVEALAEEEAGSGQVALEARRRRLNPSRFPSPTSFDPFN